MKTTHLYGFSCHQWVAHLNENTENSFIKGKRKKLSIFKWGLIENPSPEKKGLTSQTCCLWEQGGGCGAAPSPFCTMG